MKDGDCVLSLVGLNQGGYSQRRVNGRLRMAHHIAWERAHGPIPPGHETHHVCKIRNCVNPDHLRLLTRAEHVALEVSERTSCRQGHPWPEYAAVWDGQRRCRACNKQAKERLRG